MQGCLRLSTLVFVITMWGCASSPSAPQKPRSEATVAPAETLLVPSFDTEINAQRIWSAMRCENERDPFCALVSSIDALQADAGEFERMKPTYVLRPAEATNNELKKARAAIVALKMYVETLEREYSGCKTQLSTMPKKSEKQE